MEKESAIKYKNAGNERYFRKEYDEAISLYSKAIELDPNNSVFYFNRGLVYKQKKLWNNAIKDAEVSVRLDKTYVKAHLLLGQALVEAGKLDTSKKRIKAGIIHLSESVTLCEARNDTEGASLAKSYVELASKIYKLKKRAVKKEKKDDMLCDIDNLLLKQNLPDFTAKQIRDKCKHLMNYNYPESIPLDEKEFLNCRIMLQLMQNPVIDSEGHTYEKDALLMHMERNGKFDPTTRNPITDVYPNKAIKKAISTNYDEYTTEEEMAIDYHNLHFE